MLSDGTVFSIVTLYVNPPGQLFLWHKLKDFIIRWNVRSFLLRARKIADAIAEPDTICAQPPVFIPDGRGVSGVRRGLKPVASLKVKILQIKTLQNDGSTIGYGRHGIIAPEGTVIATIPAGYADGLDRHLGQGRASFLLNGHRVPTIGNICMDMCMLDITGVDAKVGDTVTIFGEDPTVTEMASILDTIPYEIMTSVPRRIKRVIIRK